MTETVKKKGGFAAMTPERRREIASKGGKSSQKRGTAHRWDEKSAQKAGRKGAAASRRSRLKKEKGEGPVKSG